MMFFHEHATAPAHRLSPREDARVVRVHLPINPREHSRYRRAPPGQQRPCPWAQFQVVPSKRRERLIKNGREMDEITRHDAHVARKRRSGPNKVAMGEKRPHLTYQAKFHRIVSLDENLAADHVANNHPMGKRNGSIQRLFVWEVWSLPFGLHRAGWDAGSRGRTGNRSYRPIFGH
jgi:hypothetical protein